MITFIKKLFSLKKDNQTVVILDSDGTKSTSHRYEPKKLWILTATAVITVIVLVILLLMFTPLGGFVYKQQQLRQSVLKMRKEVAMLQDSMHARNMQLQNLRRALFSEKDTVFTDTKLNAKASARADKRSTVSSSLVDDFQLPERAAFISASLNRESQFPAEWPVDGSLTREFNAKNGHYGIDIAGTKGEEFHAIAPGVVVGVNRSLNYGNVLYIQHADGLLTIYKHASALSVTLGDIISTGDLLGRVGDTGILSSGPHLHMELWADGIPQNPLRYLVNDT